jgi:hypothetical protein
MVERIMLDDGVGSQIEHDDKWLYRVFKDGTQQWLPLPDMNENSIGWPPAIFVERVLRPNSKRKRWCIVDRTSSRAFYPPKIAGPFKSADAAKAALLIYLAR